MIGERYVECSFCATTIAVGPSAAPIVAIEAASFVAKNIEATEQKIIAEVKNGSTLKAAREKLGYHHLQSKPEEA